MGRGKRQARPSGEFHLVDTPYGDVTAQMVGRGGDQRMRLCLNGAELARLPLETILDPDCTLLSEDGSMVLVGGATHDRDGRRVSPRARLMKRDLDVLRGLLRSGEPLSVGARARPSGLAS